MVLRYYAGRDDLGSRKLTIAIDGTIGAGKSTVARTVAQRLGYIHIDTGAMYRAVTLRALEEGVDTSDEDAVAKLAEEARIQFIRRDGDLRILIEGRDVSEQIRMPEVTNRVAPVADMPSVRRILVARQREMGREGGVVMDGRDIGTVVFPEADLKVALTAELSERTRRRHAEMMSKGVEVSLTVLEADIRERDRRDAERDYGAIADAREAIAIDTTRMAVEDVVERVVWLARRMNTCG